MHFILSPYEKPQSVDRGFYMNRCLIKGCYWRRLETRNMNAQYYAHISGRNEPYTQPFDKQYNLLEPKHMSLMKISAK